MSQVRAEMTAIHDLAVLVGATVLGDPPQYLLSAKQLVELVRLVDPGTTELLRLHDRTEKSGAKVQIIVDS